MTAATGFYIPGRATPEQDTEALLDRARRHEPRLSVTALGLFVVLLSYPPDATLTVEAFVDHEDPADNTAELFDELTAANLLAEVTTPTQEDAT